MCNRILHILSPFLVLLLFTVINGCIVKNDIEVNGGFYSDMKK